MESGEIRALEWLREGAGVWSRAWDAEESPFRDYRGDPARLIEVLRVLLEAGRLQIANL